MAVLPFGNRVVSVELTGAALRAALERALASVGRRSGGLFQVSGLTLTADLSAPEGRRLLEVRVGGAALQDDVTYRVAVSSHVASGGDGHREVAGGRRVPAPGGGVLDADALAAHVRSLSGSAAAPAPQAVRIHLLPSR
jgi:2',3'-cyclic-nucleotide 2'-phosphodiesterase (5'-nucleotidase family)